MIDFARQRAVELLKLPRKAVLITHGPAGIQASECPCEARGLELYLLVPKTCDYLFNLEVEPRVIVLSEPWQARGKALAAASPPGLEIAQAPGAAWCELVRIGVEEIQVRRKAGWGYSETIEV